MSNVGSIPNKYAGNLFDVIWLFPCCGGQSKRSRSISFFATLSNCAHICLCILPASHLGLVHSTNSSNPLLAASNLKYSAAASAGVVNFHHNFLQNFQKPNTEQVSGRDLHESHGYKLYGAPAINRPTPSHPQATPPT